VQQYKELTPAQMREIAPQLMAKEYFDRKKKIVQEFERRY
jgi:hypothetical protein